MFSSRPALNPVSGANSVLPSLFALKPVSGSNSVLPSRRIIAESGKGALTASICCVENTYRKLESPKAMHAQCQLGPQRQRKPSSCVKVVTEERYEWKPKECRRVSLFQLCGYMETGLLTLLSHAMSQIEQLRSTSRGGCIMVSISNFAKSRLVPLLWLYRAVDAAYERQT